MTALHIARARWHLDARRERLECGCIEVIPSGAAARYRSWSCLGHRWSRGDKLASRSRRPR